MTDPERLIDSGDAGADLLASARDDAPSRRARTRAAAALGIGVGVAAMTAGGTASAGAGATAAKVGTSSLLAKIIGGTLVVAAVGGGTVVAVRETSRPAPSVVTTVTTVVAPPRPSSPPVATNVAPAAPASIEAKDLAAPEPAPVSAVKTAPKPAPSSGPQESSLTRELRSLDAAKALLEAHDPNGALAALDRHDREFANGSLRAESAMVRIEALLAKGDESGAKSRARDLLAKDPNGPHAKRLRTIVER